MVSTVTHKAHTRGHWLEKGSDLHGSSEANSKDEKPDGGRRRGKRDGFTDPQESRTSKMWEPSEWVRGLWEREGNGVVHSRTWRGKAALKKHFLSPGFLCTAVTGAKSPSKGAADLPKPDRLKNKDPEARSQTRTSLSEHSSSRGRMRLKIPNREPMA